MPEVGKYIYCIIETNRERSFSIKGIGGRGDEVYTVCYQDLAAVISDSPIIKYPISRENLLAHQLIMEEVMKDYTLLPVRFSTIGEDVDKIKEKVLKERYTEFKDLLKEMNNKVELGVKALWTNMDVIFQEIAEENKEIKRLRNRIVERTSLQSQTVKVELGKMVKVALEEKKVREEGKILSVLKRPSVDFRTNKIFGDNMIINAAFLVAEDKMKEFDERMDELTSRYDGRVKFKYVGPVVIWNFVNIVITW